MNVEEKKNKKIGDLLTLYIFILKCKFIECINLIKPNINALTCYTCYDWNWEYWHSWQLQKSSGHSLFTILYVRLGIHVNTSSHMLMLRNHYNYKCLVDVRDSV